MPKQEKPFKELFLGDAYKPHSGNVELPLAQRFAGQTLLIIGGGGAQTGWTQLATFDRAQKLTLGPKSERFRKTGDGWATHLKSQAGRCNGWAVIVMEQWLAAVGSGSVDRELKILDQLTSVRERPEDFGGDKLGFDVVRSAVDHPTMEASIVFAVKSTTLEVCIREAASAGLEIAAVRVPAMSLLEVHLSDLRNAKEVLSKPLIVCDGPTMAVINVVNGEFDRTEGGLSYTVARPENQSTTAHSRLSAKNARSESIAVTVVGLPLAGPQTGLVVEEKSVDPVLALLDSRSIHDFRPVLLAVRPEVPKIIRPVVYFGLFGSILMMLLGGFFLWDGFQASSQVAVLNDSLNSVKQEIAQRKTKAAALEKEFEKARFVGRWVQKNYHAQKLVYSILKVVPKDVLIDELSFDVAQDNPQGTLKFILSGNEEAQRSAARAIEKTLYLGGYEIGKREDPTAASSAKGRKGAVQYSWTLIIPTFGR